MMLETVVVMLLSALYWPRMALGMISFFHWKPPVSAIERHRAKVKMMPLTHQKALSAPYRSKMAGVNRMRAKTNLRMPQKVT